MIPVIIVGQTGLLIFAAWNKTTQKITEVLFAILCICSVLFVIHMIFNWGWILG
jgi:hypothetical protein